MHSVQKTVTVEEKLHAWYVCTCYFYTFTFEDGYTTCTPFGHGEEVCIVSGLGLAVEWFLGNTCKEIRGTVKHCTHEPHPPKEVVDMHKLPSHRTVMSLPWVQKCLEAAAMDTS